MQKASGNTRDEHEPISSHTTCSFDSERRRWKHGRWNGYLQLPRWECKNHNELRSCTTSFNSNSNEYSSDISYSAPRKNATIRKTGTRSGRMTRTMTRGQYRRGNKKSAKTPFVISDSMLGAPARILIMCINSLMATCSLVWFGASREAALLEMIWITTITALTRGTSGSPVIPPDFKFSL